MSKVFDPITLLEYDINEWLSLDKNDNIIFIINDKLFGLKRSYFILNEKKLLYTECNIYNNQLIVDTTYNNDKYINIYFLTGINLLIPINKFNNCLNNNLNTNIFKVNSLNNKIKSIKLDTIELFYLGHVKNKNKNKNKIQLKENFIINDFNLDNIVESNVELALKNYSYEWDQAMNQFLLNGENYFNSDIFLDLYERYGNTITNAKENVKSQINILDNYFNYNAPRVTNYMMSQRVFYRGMKNPYYLDYNKKIPADNICDTFLIKNFISVSQKDDIAFNFIGSGCCLYIFKLDEGIPFIDMQLYSKYNYKSSFNEYEILLPRNLIATIIDITLNSYNTEYDETLLLKTYYIRLSTITPKQFDNTISLCKDINIGEIKPNTNISSLNTENKYGGSINSITSSIVISNIKATKYKHKYPNGMRRNKKTRNYYLKKSQTKKSQKKKMKRCPKGTRRNKKTGNCEIK